MYKSRLQTCGLTGLIGDQQMADDGVKDDKWPEWLLNNQSRTSGRYTFTNYNPYKKESPLFKSGLIGRLPFSNRNFNRHFYDQNVL